jgi:hypothetical protein
MGPNFIERDVFLGLMRDVRRVDGTEYQDLQTVYGDMSRLVVAWLARTPPEDLAALYTELNWGGQLRTARQMHLAAQQWMERHRAFDGPRPPGGDQGQTLPRPPCPVIASDPAG